MFPASIPLTKLSTRLSEYCCCCLGCTHFSFWAWVIDNSLAYRNSLRSTHCRELLYLTIYSPDYFTRTTQLLPHSDHALNYFELHDGFLALTLLYRHYFGIVRPPLYQPLSNLYNNYHINVHSLPWNFCPKKKTFWGRFV